MSRAPTRFKQNDVLRVLRAARAAGLDVASVEVDAAGRIVVTTTNSDGAEQKHGTELDKWMARRAG
jgi:hypothetical protein